METTPTKTEEQIEKVTSTLPKDTETPDQKGQDPTPSSEKKDEGNHDEPADPNKDPKDPQDPTPTPEPEYKTKFRKSASEANRLLDVNKGLTEIIKSFTTADQVTEDEMRQIHPDFDDMTPAEQNRWTRLEMDTRRNNRIIAEEKKREIVANKEKALGIVIGSHPLLEKNKDAFIEFASKPENELVSLETLAKSFLFDLEDKDPELPSDKTPKPEPTMERGSGTHGDTPKLPNTEKKVEEMNDDELADLMVREPKKYMDHVQKMAKRKR